jgi:hypothetical protein
MTENQDGNHVDKMLGVVAACLSNRGLKFGRHPGTAAIVFTGPGKSASIHSGIIRVRENRRYLRCFVFVPCRIPAEKRFAAAELLNRINFGLPLGVFEMDFTDGEVGYRTSIDVADGELTEGMVEVLVGASLATTDRYLPAIMSFLWNDTAPEDAVAMIEGAAD